MDRDDFAQVSGTDYIRAMFAATQEGKLTIGTEENGWETFEMDWTKSQVEEVVTRFENLLKILTRLGREHAYWEASTKDMPQELLEVWNTYILPYPDHGMDHDALYEASMNAELNLPLTPEEEALLDKEAQWLYENALTRLPFVRCNPAALIQRAKRYEKLVSIHAPRVVTDYEARFLAEEMALYYCQAE